MAEGGVGGAMAGGRTLDIRTNGKLLAVKRELLAVKMKLLAVKMKLLAVILFLLAAISFLLAVICQKPIASRRTDRTKRAAHPAILQ